MARLPLFGIPFAVKDNIDAAGLATTAGCAAFAYEPTEPAPSVARLLEAGALLVGKTNLDQFATGLVGTRSPYGVARNPFDPRYISGGSSSGLGGGGGGGAGQRSRWAPTRPVPAGCRRRSTTSSG